MPLAHAVDDLDREGADDGTGVGDTDDVVVERVVATAECHSARYASGSTSVCSSHRLTSGWVAPGEHRVEVGVGGRAQLEPLGVPRPQLGSGHAPAYPRGLARDRFVAGRAYGTLARHEHRRRRSRPDLTTFVAGLPKAELHVHHVGSASPRIVAELAARHPDSPVPQDAAGAGALLHLHRLRPLHRRLPRDRRACCAPPRTCGC